MDLRTVVTISTLLLVTVESEHMLSNSTTGTTPTTNNRRSECTCPNVAHEASATPTTTRSPPALGLITIKWIKKCEGAIYLTLHDPFNSSSPVCHSSNANLQSVLKDVCKNKKGCKGTLRWVEGSQSLHGVSLPLTHYMTENGPEKGTGCGTLRVQCTVEVLPDERGYKVVTALLSCVLVVLLLMRFTRPTVKALQKRFSDRRQNRWVGPTQSHSVSYHRGKTAVKNDGEKRLSYPALEQLMVSDSREPSSNRNSGYNL